MRHFITTQDWSREELQQLIEHGRRLRERPIQPLLEGKTVALVFFNPSLRTRTSFEIGTWQLGGHAVVLEPGKGAWPIEFDMGAVMDGEAEEHVREAARVLGRYCDLIAVRRFPKFQDMALDFTDHVVRSFAEHTTVPVVNMETIEHPCQELAHVMALQDRLGDLKGKKYVLTWTYHPKPLNTAVANSAAMIATKFGMDVTLLCPDERYRLHEKYMRAAAGNAAESGGSFTVSHDIEAAYSGAEIVYAKSWGAPAFYGDWGNEKPVREQYKHFMVDERKMALTNGAVFGHCLPARRNVKATDAVMDAPYSMIVDEAENRLHVQKAIMSRLIGAEGGGS